MHHLHSHQQCANPNCSIYLSTLSDDDDDLNLEGVELYLIIILICNSLMTSVEHLFMGLLVTWMSFWKSVYLVPLFMVFFFSLNCFVVFELYGFLCIVDVNTLSDISFVVQLLSRVELFCDPYGL